MEQQFEQLFRTRTATVVDVRTPEEFMGGLVVGSINIPLQEIPGRIQELKDIKNRVVCSASGGRSLRAVMRMKQEGVEVIDEGSWLNINYLINKSI